MRRAATGVALIALQGSLHAGPLRGCDQVAAEVDTVVAALLAGTAQPEANATQFRAQFGACLKSRNICTVVHNARHGELAVLAGDVTADLPAQTVSGIGQPSIVFLARSIPRVGNDANKYCLVARRSSAASSLQRWEVYGWVLPPNDGQPLPLPGEALDDKGVSDSRTLRSLAAALWFFAQRMSGQFRP
jgi:hypothetical protein